jgi:hypothetical protein
VDSIFGLFNVQIQYLKNNPKAAFIVIEPGDAPMTWKGVRLYLEVDAMERYGELVDSFRKNIRKLAGDQSADAIVAAIRFKVTEVRPLIACICKLTPSALKTTAMVLLDMYIRNLGHWISYCSDNQLKGPNA